MARVISVFNVKGGNGKTGGSLEFATYLANEGFRVLMIDLDQQCDLSKYMGANLETKSIFEILYEKMQEIPITYTRKKVEESDKMTYIQDLGNVDMIISSSRISKSDKTFAVTSEDAEEVFLLSDVVEDLSEEYDYIIIDHGPSRSVILTMMYIASDYIVVPSECDEGSLDGIESVFSDLYKMQHGTVQYPTGKVIGVFLNKYENTLMHRNAYKDIEKIVDSLGDGHIVIDKIRKSILASECKKAKMSLQEYANSEKITKDYKRFFKAVMKEIEANG